MSHAVFGDLPVCPQPQRPSRQGPGGGGEEET